MDRGFILSSEENNYSKMSVEVGCHVFCNFLEVIQAAGISARIVRVCY